MAGERPLVSVVVLSYNRPSYLARALDALVAQADDDVEIIVVDNLSPSSQEVARVVSRFPQTRLIANQENTGFSGGMNIGISAARGRYVYLTEDDVVLDPQCLTELRAHAGTRPTGGLSTGIMIDDSSDTILSAGGYVRLGAVFTQEIVAQGQPDRGQLIEPYEVTFIPGAMMFAPRALFERVGRFREEFFVYYEDVDYCIRAIKAGYRITVVPTAKVRHLARASGPIPDSVEFHSIKNFMAVNMLHAPLRALPAFLIRYGPLRFLRASSSRERRLVLRGLGWTAARAIPLLWERFTGNGRLRFDAPGGGRPR